MNKNNIEQLCINTIRTLSMDAMTGDSTLFIRADEVDAAWSLVDPILQGWAEEAFLHIYPYITGSWGPQAADEFMNKDN